MILSVLSLARQQQRHALVMHWKLLLLTECHSCLSRTHQVLVKTWLGGSEAYSRGLSTCHVQTTTTVCLTCVLSLVQKVSCMPLSVIWHASSSRASIQSALPSVMYVLLLCHFWLFCSEVGGILLVFWIHRACVAAGHNSVLVSKTLLHNWLLKISYKDFLAYWKKLLH